MNDRSRKDRVADEDGEATATPHPLLDTSHLEHQIQGDEELRDELLRLYASRLEVLGAKLREAAGSERREAAHTLKGASLAVGALALAQLCHRLEAGEAADARELARLIEATRLRVGELLRAA